MSGVNTIKYLWAGIFFIVLIWSGIDPKDQITWLLEILPALIGAALLVTTYRSFKLTSIVYLMILAHCIVLMIGGHYTYAEVPFFDGLFGAERNNYDKLGHFFQGFVPALIAREILIRKHVVNGRWWLSLFVICVALSFSAFYELIEWWVAVISGGGAEAFLGTQGYIWDTQSDMAFALVGAISSLVFLSKFHDKQIKNVVG
ncbi:putative membrane protein [Marinobacter antarcticus]|uniref:Putative membrane protein n=1 Tax=Marinobacter antarcticus TaxID=564117 RepID=A0A1M6PBM7_9GAMM|nr:putative membrane protein [Marinobacter antarcticus]